MWLHHQMLSVSYISRESWVVCLLLLCSLMMCANDRVHCHPMVVDGCLHYRFIIILQTYLKVLNFTNACQERSVSSVGLRFRQFSQLYFMHYMGLCVFSLPIYPMTNVRIRVLYLITIIKSDVRSIWHCLWLGHETIVSAVCIFIFEIAINLFIC